MLSSAPFNFNNLPSWISESSPSSSSQIYLLSISPYVYIPNWFSNIFFTDHTLSALFEAREPPWLSLGNPKIKIKIIRIRDHGLIAHTSTPHIFAELKNASNYYFDITTHNVHGIVCDADQRPQLYTVLYGIIIMSNIMYVQFPLRGFVLQLIIIWPTSKNLCMNNTVPAQPDWIGVICHWHAFPLALGLLSPISYWACYLSLYSLFYANWSVSP